MTKKQRPLAHVLVESLAQLFESQGYKTNRFFATFYVMTLSGDRLGYISYDHNRIEVFRPKSWRNSLLIQYFDPMDPTFDPQQLLEIFRITG